MNASVRPQRRTNADITAETRSKILQAAVGSLAELGYAGTTMSEIAKRVGVSRAALIYHYQTKNALMAAVIDAIYEELGMLYRAAAHPSLTVPEKLLAVLDASYRFTDTESQIAQVELLLAARRDPMFRREVGPTIESHDRALNEHWALLTADMTAGPERLALLRDFAVSVFRGIAINRSLGGSDASFKRQHVVLHQLFKDVF